MPNFFDAFISYGRADSKTFAFKLNQKLTGLGLKVWFDQEDIPLAVDYQEQINDGIEKAHNFIFIIAPHSVNSPYCLKEIELAIGLNKRIIPLLHVEKISRETWQSRNSDQTEADWQEYQAQGLHSCHPNMHPTIQKINWVYFRENIDDFESSFAGLLETINRHQDYVQKHTNFLVQALDWSRNQKQNNYLLIGEERHETEKWLKHKFTDELPPCLPTDLHCEFISESTKNANNLMTQVFLAYSEEDEAIKEKIRQTLMREGLTIWTNKTDIKSGSAFQDEIKRGIEGADNLIYLMSRDSLESQYCQQELAHAFAYNKRIIPLRIENNLKIPPTPLLKGGNIPESLASPFLRGTGGGSPEAYKKLQKIQSIDLTEFEEDNNYRDGIDKLLKELKTDEPYYENHKVLLVKALEWQRKDKNPCILLRGYNLQHFEAWLKAAKQKKYYPPIPLQEEFISESIKHPKPSSLEVFISYSRADSDLARKLNKDLISLGKLTWFDQESIASGEDFQQEIYRGIESSDNFLFIISPKAVTSPYCASEVEYAQKLNKRIITILHQKVGEKDLHPALAKVQWLDFSKHGGNYLTNFAQLVRTIHTDREHVQSHTKWSQRALEWQKQDSEDLLLRGSELAIAENWLEEAQKNNKQPSATDLQKEFIGAGVALRDRIETEKANRRRRNLRSAWIIAGIMAGLGLFAGIQWYKAVIDEIRAWTELSKASLLTNEQLKALVSSVKAGKKLKEFKPLKQLIKRDSTLENDVEIALRNIVYNIEEFNHLEGHNDKIYSVSFSPDNELIASASRDKTAKLWDLQGNLQTNLNHDQPVRQVNFSPDGKLIASASEDKTVKLWDLQGKLQKTLQHSVPLFTVTFTPKSCPKKLIASSGKDGIIRLWSWEGKLQKAFATNASNTNTQEKQINDLRFSPDCQKIASANADKTLQLWDLQGKRLATVIGHEDTVGQINFSSDGKTIASASSDTTVKLWTQDNQGKFKSNPNKTLKGHTNWVTSMSFFSNNDKIISASDDHTVRIWDSDGNLLYTHILPDAINNISISSNEKLIALASNKKIILWKRGGMVIETLRGHSSGLKGVSFSPDGELIASVSTDETVRLWENNCNTKLIELKKTLKYEAGLRSVNFTPDGNNIVTASYDNTMQLWNIKDALASQNPSPKQTFRGHTSTVENLSISPDGKKIASASLDGTVRLWHLDGREFGAPFKHCLKDDEIRCSHDNDNGEIVSVNDVSFSSDGKRIVSVDAEGYVRVWNINGQLIQKFRGHDDEINALMFSRDGKFIATASNDNTIKLWKDNKKGGFDEKAHQTLDTSLGGHQDWVWDVAFSFDGNMIASAGKDEKVKLWKMDDQDKFELMTTLQGHKDWVRALSFNSKSNNKLRLVSASADKTIIVWKIKDIVDIETTGNESVLDSLLKKGCEWLSKSNYLQNNSNLAFRRKKPHT